MMYPCVEDWPQEAAKYPSLPHIRLRPSGGAPFKPMIFQRKQRGGCGDEATGQFPVVEPTYGMVSQCRSVRSFGRSPVQAAHKMTSRLVQMRGAANPPADRWFS